MRIASLALILFAGAGSAAAFDSLGGFDRPYSNDGRAFGHGAWGDGNGTALPLPGPRAALGFSYERPYGAGDTLFGTGFWAAEYEARVSGDGTVRFLPGRNAPAPYLPLLREREAAAAPAPASGLDLGRLDVKTPPGRSAVTAICLDGNGDEYAALAVKPEGAGPDYAGEIFRCEGERMLRVSYATGAVSIPGSVRTADGTSYKDCNAGEALIRSRKGALACAAKRPMSPGMERALASSAEAVETVQTAGDGAPPADAIDISGMELTGGVGGL